MDDNTRLAITTLEGALDRLKKADQRINTKCAIREAADILTRTLAEAEKTSYFVLYDLQVEQLQKVINTLRIIEGGVPDETLPVLTATNQVADAIRTLKGEEEPCKSE